MTDDLKRIVEDCRRYALPDPNDERDVCPKWLAGKLREVADRIEAALLRRIGPADGEPVPLGPHLVSMASAFQTGNVSKFVTYGRIVADAIGPPHGKYLRRVCDDIETGKPPVFIHALESPR